MLNNKNRQPRIEATLTVKEKAIVKKAAQMMHLSVSDFIRSKIVNSAQEVIQDSAMTVLNAEDSEKFIEHMLNPPKDMIKKLKKGMDEYKKARKQGIITFR